MVMMRIKKHVVGMFASNAYLVWDEGSRAGVVIDPGGGADKLLEAIAEHALDLEAIIHTHGHRDHTWATKAIQRQTGAPVYRFPGEPGGMFFARPRKTDDKKTFDLADGQELVFGSLLFSVIHTPGHSPGSVCLYSEGDRFQSGETRVLFTGDLLFKDGVGRMDLKGGSFREMATSLNQRLAAIDDDTDVLPGHGPATTLGKERKTNPFFRMARDRKRSGGGDHGV